MESPETRYKVRPSRIFLEQAKDLTNAEKELVNQKLSLACQNPFRFKSLYATGLTKIFEIKIMLQGNYSRIIYSIEKDELFVEGILKRKNEFKDLLPLVFKSRQERQP